MKTNMNTIVVKGNDRTLAEYPRISMEVAHHVLEHYKRCTTVVVENKSYTVRSIETEVTPKGFITLVNLTEEYAH